VTVTAVSPFFSKLFTASESCAKATETVNIANKTPQNKCFFITYPFLVKFNKRYTHIVLRNLFFGKPYNRFSNALMTGGRRNQRPKVQKRITLHYDIGRWVTALAMSNKGHIIFCVSGVVCISTTKQTDAIPTTPPPPPISNS
jgi:hypothetical protein